MRSETQCSSLVALLPPHQKETSFHMERIIRKNKMAGCVWLSGQTVASSSQSVARTESCQHRVWRASQRGLNILSQDADSQIPATRLQRQVPHPRSRLECTVKCLAFGFDSSLYPGSIPAGVEVHGWHHGRVLGFNGLRIHKELEGLKFS